MDVLYILGILAIIFIAIPTGITDILQTEFGPFIYFHEVTTLSWWMTVFFVIVIVAILVFWQGVRSFLLYILLAITTYIAYHYYNISVIDSVGSFAIIIVMLGIMRKNGRAVVAIVSLAMVVLLRFIGIFNNTTMYYFVFIIACAVVVAIFLNNRHFPTLKEVLNYIKKDV